jgi:hypothetical protein
MSRIALDAEQAVFALIVFFAAPNNVFGGALLAPCHDPSILPQAQREQKFRASLRPHSLS